MSLILTMEADLKIAWDIVQNETDRLLRAKALRVYKEKLAAFLKQRLFIASMENSDEP